MAVGHKGEIKLENKYTRFIQKSHIKGKYIVQCKNCGKFYHQWLNNYYIEQDPCRCTTKILNKRLYRTFYNMIHRCYRKKQEDYPRYGGQGIRVCDEWRNNYKAFETWALNNGYSDDLTLDRIDYELDYSPNNCRWVDILTQNNNQKSNIMFIIEYHKASLRRICEVFDINYKTEEQYYKKNGYDATLIDLVYKTQCLILFYDKDTDINLPLLRTKKDILNL